MKHYYGILVIYDSKTRSIFPMRSLKEAEAIKPHLGAPDSLKFVVVSDSSFEEVQL